MICAHCQGGYHEVCPEVARQADPDISDLDKAASAWCYCAHRPRRGPDDLAEDALTSSGEA